jgi:hypothetical protein
VPGNGEYSTKFYLDAIPALIRDICMPQRKKITEIKIREWREWNERLTQDAQQFCSELEKYLGKKKGLRIDAERILSLHRQIENYFLPRQPRDTRFDDLFQYNFDPNNCAFCGLVATNHFTLVHDHQSLKFSFCESCAIKHNINVDFGNTEAILLKLQKLLPNTNAS